MAAKYIHLGRIKTIEEFEEHLKRLQIEIPFDGQIFSGDAQPLANSYKLPNGRIIGNRFCVNPMEGWDGTHDGNPTEYVFRRWEKFGQSGAKLIWEKHLGSSRPRESTPVNAAGFDDEEY